jgi:hypothetical protein
VLSIFQNDAASTRLVVSQLHEQQKEWELERRHFFSEVTMAKILAQEEPMDLIDGERA